MRGKKKLGSGPDKRFWEASLARRQAKARERAADIAPVIAELRAAGLTSLKGIGKALRERGIAAPRGGETWAPTQVKRLLALLPPDADA